MRRTLPGLVNVLVIAPAPAHRRLRIVRRQPGDLHGIQATDGGFNCPRHQTPTSATGSPGMTMRRTSCRSTFMPSRSRLLLVALSLVASGCNTERLARLEKENRDISARLEAVTKAANLDLQEKCSNQASSVSRQMGLKSAFAVYTNHYNPKLNKCFITVFNTATVGSIPTVSMWVQDAYEGKEYAEYFWINRHGQWYLEVKPDTCKVTLLSGIEKTCESQEEFEQLIKVYMDQ